MLERDEIRTTSRCCQMLCSNRNVLSRDINEPNTYCTHVTNTKKRVRLIHSYTPNWTTVTPYTSTSRLTSYPASSTSKTALHALSVLSQNTNISPRIFILYTGSKSPSASTTSSVPSLTPFSSTTSHHIFSALSILSTLAPPVHHPSSPFVVHQSSEPSYQTAVFPNSSPGFGKHFHQHSAFPLSQKLSHHPTHS